MARKNRFVNSLVLILGLMGVSFWALSQDVQSALDAAASSDEAARRSQDNIDQVVDETRELARQYSAITKEIDGLKVYNSLLEKQVEGQTQEMEDLRNSVDQVSVIERQVMPLMMEMVESLDQFVALDVPFLLNERQERVEFLRTLLERSDITVAEKFRRVLEAYEIENDYGRTIEAYKGSLELDGASREVDFLRIGRTALLYQTVDAEIYGMWEHKTRTWAPLPTEYRNQIREGIRIARKQIAPNLLILPVPSPEDAE